MKDKLTDGFKEFSKEYTSKLKEAEKIISSMEDFSMQTINSSHTNFSIFDQKHVLYYFELPKGFGFSPNEICSVISKEKEDNKTLKLPKVNASNANGEKNRILYVGKSSGKFSTRLKQHLFNNSKSTYALHLSEWQRIFNTEKELNLNLYFVSFSDKIKEANKDVLEIIETSLHYQLKPILGRTGH